MILDDKAAALAKEQAIQDKLNTIDRLQQQLAEVQSAQQAENEAERVLSQMLDAGFVQRNENGEWGPGPNAGGED